MANCAEAHRTPTKREQKSLLKVTGEHRVGYRDRMLCGGVSWYFSNESLQDYAGRYTVIRGDVGQEHFGLADDMYERLCSEIEAIYHFAADIRLFGGNQGFEKQNIDSVKTAIQMASLQKPKALHYMSTLAVCGINSKPQSVVFSEHCLDIGQEASLAPKRSGSARLLARCRARRPDALGCNGWCPSGGDGFYRWCCMRWRPVPSIRTPAAISCSPRGRHTSAP